MRVHALQTRILFVHLFPHDSCRRIFVAMVLTITSRILFFVAPARAVSLFLSLSLLSRIFVFFPPRGKKEEKVEGKRRKRGSRIKQISKRVLPSYFCTRDNTYDRYDAQPTYEWICWHPDGLEIYSAYHHAHNFYDRIGPLDDGPKQ